MPGTTIMVFGALEVVHDHVSPQRPPTQKVLSLLGYLVAHANTPQSRDKLVDLLWPDVLPRQGRRMLSDTLWRARRLLTLPGAPDTPLLDISGSAVTFRPDDRTSVDLLDFERLLAPLAAQLSAPADAGLDPSAIQNLREAVALYRGDLLEDCYDDWTLYERERLRELYLGALQHLLAHDIAAQSYDLALQLALRLAQADPLREEGHRDLIRVYYLLGRTADALRAYEQCRKLLDEELGAEPDPDTVSLYEEILSLHQRRLWEPGQPPAAGPMRATLPEPPLVGRLDQRAELMDAIEQAIAGAGGLLLLAGDAGLGKSRLLHEVAKGAEWRGAQVSWGYGREDAQAQPLGALREALAASITPARARDLAAMLSDYTLGTLALLLPDLAAQLPAGHPQPQPAENQLAQLHAAMAETLLALGQMAPQLIILEDVHWFDPATLSMLGAIVPALGNARVLLLISGRPSEIAQRPATWDTLLQLDRSGLLRRVDLHGLSETECADMVRRTLRMRQLAPRFSARLHQATGGNPYFVLQALQTLQEQGALTRNSQGIWHTPWDGPESDYQGMPLPAGLHDAIAERLRGLQPETREALAAAAVLGQNFTPQALEQMYSARARSAGQPAIPDHATPSEPPWHTLVQQLIRRQFLVEDAGSYRFGHETLREVIYGDLDDDTRRTLHMRAAETLEREHFARVEALAQHLYLAGAWEKSLPYLIQAGERAQAIYAWQDALRCYDQAIEAAAHTGAARPDMPQLWEIQLRRAAVATPLGDYPTALAAYEAALQLAERAPPGADLHALGTAQIQALSGMIYVYGLRNDYARARELVHQAMTLAVNSPQPLQLAEVYYQAGLISLRLGDYPEARYFWAEAMQLYSALDQPANRAKCLTEISWSHLRQDGPTDQAIALFHEALAIYQRLGDRFDEHICLAFVANAQMMRGHISAAQQALDRCLPFFRTIGALDNWAWCLFIQGEVALRAGQPEQAIALQRESIALCERLGHSAASAFSSVSIAAALRDLRQPDEALALLAAPQAMPDRLIKTRALLIAADIWRLKGQIARAWQCIERGMELAQGLGTKTYTGIFYRQLAQLRAADTRGQLPPPGPATPNAESCLQTSIQLLQGAHCDDELAQSWQEQGRQLIASARYQEALAALQQALALFQQCGMPARVAAAQELFRSLAQQPMTLHPGQRRILLARQGTPRGRPLRADELIEVIWSVDLPEQPGRDRASLRQEQLRRLCAEASAQGAEPTVGDLASALGVTARTIDRDIAALRATGVALATRGSGG